MHRLSLLAGLALLLSVPASAAAAPFGELPPAATGGVATCLRATGAPGELVRSSPNGARFLQVGAAGIADTGLVVTGAPRGECAQVAARPGGAAVIAQSGAGLWVATRDPGGEWTKPAKLAQEASRAAVAVADSGAAVVAWLEPGTGERFAVKAMRRPAGGAFGPAVTLGSASSAGEFLTQGSIRAAIAGDGETFVLWTQPPPDRDTGRMPVNVAIAPAGGDFAASRRIGLTHVSSAPALAAGPDGRALVVLWTGREVQVAERAPAGAFAPPAAIASPKEPYTVLPAAALGAGGAAVVGWYGLFSQGVGAVARAAAGPFGAPVTLAEPGGIPGLSNDLLTLLSAFGLGQFGPAGAGGLGADTGAGDLRAVLTPDGSALLTWGDELSVPRAAAFPLSGGHLDRFPVGAGVRKASSITPLVTAAGTPAVAWSDNDGSSSGGRVHVAVEGVAAAPPAPAPGVELGRPLKPVLGADDPLRLPVTCRAACDVRVDLPDRGVEPAYVSLTHPGTRVLVLQSVFSPIAPPRRGPVRVRVRYAARGASAATERIDTVVLERSKTAGPPAVIGLKAVRHGSRVDVSWRTDRDADPDLFAVAGSDGRALDSNGLVVAEAKRAGKRRFTARLTGAKEVRYVFVFAGDGSGSIGGPSVTRVR